MRYPYQRFLKFLVSRKVDVNQALDRYGLPSVGGMWTAECRTDIRKHAPHPITHFIDSKDEELTFREGVLEWAEEEGFRELWEIQHEFGDGTPVPELDLGFRIFINPFARAVLGLLLLSRATDEEIQDLIQDRFDLEISQESLALYRRLFWDIKIMSRTQWNSFVKKLSIKEERNYIALGLASPTYDEVRSVLGLEISLEPEFVLKQIMSKAQMQFNRAMDEPHPESAGAIRWADLSIRATNALSNQARNLSMTRENDGIIPSDFSGMFAVKVSKTEHLALSDLKGELGAPKDPAPTDED